MDEEPQYAEIAEVHPLPRDVGEGTLAAWVTLPNASPFHSSTMETTLPSLANSTLLSEQVAALMQVGDKEPSVS